VDSQALLLGGLLQTLQIKEVIPLDRKNGLSIIAPLNNVLRLAREQALIRV